MIGRLNHLAIAVPDLDAATALYRDTLGAKVGAQYNGVVTGVTNFGVFVQIPELQIDGLVHVTSLQNDYYKFDPGSQSLVGERSGQRYGLGDKMEIVVAKVDLETKRIDFQLVANGRKPRSGAGGRRKAKPGGSRKVKR